MSNRGNLSVQVTRLTNLSPQMALKAEKELNEVPEKISKEVQALREMIEDVPHLKPLLSDEFLIRFLRARKYNRDRAFKLYMKYFKMKVNNPSVLGDLLPSKSAELINANLLSILPYRDDQGRAICILRSDRWDPSKHSLEHVVRMISFCAESTIPDENVQVCGCVTILDLEHFSLRHLQHIRPSVVSKLIHLVQDSFPSRFKGFHLVRESVFVDIAYTIFKPILSAKLKKRVFFHGYNMELLHRHINPDYLPSEYGGKRGPMDHTWFPKHLYEKEDLFQNLLSYGFKKTGS